MPKLLLGADKADARRECPALPFAENSKLRRVHHIVHHVGIRAVCCVFKNSAQAEVRSTEMKFPFESWAEVDVRWKAL